MTDLRSQLRERRQALSFEDRRRKSLAISEHLNHYLPFVRTDNVALYYSTPEEVDTTGLIMTAAEQGKTIYLPVVNTSEIRSDAMLFARFDPGTTGMKKNRYGIPEPDVAVDECLRSDELSFICVPMVGFNQRCDRIGMGAGYYDRALENNGVRKPHLVGLAFRCQNAEFEPAPHDVPMDAVVTEDGVLKGVKSGQHPH
ncbi:MAG: 5-formyltetrahydrofolate cyclo-ligase [Pseudomonadales bacterium]|nr:5-formyltetrahydrofolate cyclo-ligase [Pseudomonadales bacterium]MBO6564534.1 5-formyltetrahydrofolate cyclo-ligase [Pseudomonadales bacterium]MBO6597335.1 5-formyltetrahydrofolate cyclo-ligase [Pseudomonadales bacterium]MBO6703171.1 5-formyltetrahydrofolate cyclo-ligase [Pseudomonadales bacterium]MBO6824069.1 5-formyltetrahydrofolate cyclo-ligase [Pseudomonadales bacterium]